MTGRFSLLNELLLKATGRQDLEYIAAMRAIKRYLNEITDDQFRHDVRLIDDPDLFRYLIAAGLSRSRQDILVELKEDKGK